MISVKSKTNFLRNKKIGHKIYKPKSTVVFTKLNSMGAIFNLKDRHFYSLNETAVGIWELIERKMSVEDMVEQLICEYDISRKMAKQSIIRQLQDLLSHGLIEPI